MPRPNSVRRARSAGVLSSLTPSQSSIFLGPLHRGLSLHAHRIAITSPLSQTTAATVYLPSHPRVLSPANCQLQLTSLPLTATTAFRQTTPPVFIRFDPSLARLAQLEFSALVSRQTPSDSTALKATSSAIAQRVAASRLRQQLPTARFGLYHPPRISSPHPSPTIPCSIRDLPHAKPSSFVMIASLLLSRSSNSSAH